MHQIDETLDKNYIAAALSYIMAENSRPVVRQIICVSFASVCEFLHQVCCQRDVGAGPADGGGGCVVRQNRHKVTI